MNFHALFFHHCLFPILHVYCFHYVIYVSAKKTKASKDSWLSSANEVKDGTERPSTTTIKGPKEARSLSVSNTLYMLPRSKRLSVPLFTNVLANGSIVHSPLFTARILKTAQSKVDSRFSAVISKKIAKTAVERNKFRRRIYSGVAAVDKKVKPGFQIILMAKPTLTKALLKEITADLEALFVKSNLLK